MSDAENTREMRMKLAAWFADRRVVGDALLPNEFDYGNADALLRDFPILMGSPERPNPQLIYTVRRSPYTAGAKRAAGYGYVDLEYPADSAQEAVDKAVRDCEWQDARRNFGWRVVATKVSAA